MQHYQYPVDISHKEADMSNAIAVEDIIHISPNTTLEQRTLDYNT
jgi:hypothetical protein